MAAKAATLALLAAPYIPRPANNHGSGGVTGTDVLLIVGAVMVVMLAAYLYGKVAKTRQENSDASSR